MSIPGTWTGDRAVAGGRPGAPPPLPANTRVPSVLGRGASGYGRGREVAALVLWTLAIFLCLALASFRGDPSATTLPTPTPSGPDWVGPVGAASARLLVSLVGVVSWGLPVELILLGVPLVRGKQSPATAGRIAGDFLLVVVAAALVQVGSPSRTAFGTFQAGGGVGEVFGELARSLFSTAGSFLVGFACLGLILIGRAAFSFIAFARLIASLARRAASWLAEASRALAEAWRRARELEAKRREAARRACEPRIDTSPKDEAIVAALPLDVDEGLVEALADATSVPKRRPKRLRGGKPPPDSLLDPSSRDDELGPGNPTAEAVPVLGEVSGAAQDGSMPRPRVEPRSPSGDPPGAHEPLAVPPEPEPSSDDADAKPVPVADPAGSPQVASDAPATRAKRARALPTIIDTSAALQREAPPTVPTRVVRSLFELPNIEMLVAEKADPSLAIDRDKLLANAQKLVETLAHYGVQGKVEDILPGPTVTTYEVSPAAGTKVSKVASLADDLALALARKVRIVAPIPGKNRIGFELPNDRRVKVVLRDLIEDRRFQTLEVPLPVVLGRDILGNPVYADLASMPHVIVAGATGAGKSVGLNVMLLSLLYRRSPDELRLLMIDPKVVELAPFDRIPHMLLPVVTDMKQAATALKWAVDEMERRYQLFADAGTKNVATYNAWVERVLRRDGQATPLPSGRSGPRPVRMVVAKDHNGFPEEIPAEAGSDEGSIPLPEKLPWVVVVVDEFADLMMQQGKEVEAAVARIAQKARAAGMHVILATQRPSTDVITGTIKANFPTRIAYRVAQKVDSRTILDEQGAEHLLGMGDMLIKLNGTGETKRVQCPWVSEEEVQRVTDFLRTQGEPVYDDNILKPRDDDDAALEEADAEQDPLYDDAVRVVAETRRCSTSWLQRKLGLGYNRAARIVEMMERRGLVGAPHGAKDREVLVDPI